MKYKINWLTTKLESIWKFFLWNWILPFYPNSSSDISQTDKRQFSCYLHSQLLFHFRGWQFLTLKIDILKKISRKHIALNVVKYESDCFKSNLYLAQEKCSPTRYSKDRQNGVQLTLDKCCRKKNLSNVATCRFHLISFYVIKCER